MTHNHKESKVEESNLEPQDLQIKPARKLDTQAVEKAVVDFLVALGEDPTREGLVETPARVARACEEIFAGLYTNPTQHLYKQFHESDDHGVVIVRDIPFFSVCEHHLLPFFGTAQVMYVPRDNKICGLSKVARCVQGFAARPQVQENLGSMIADAFVEALNPRGVLVQLEAQHLCMSMRGVKVPGSTTKTIATRGIFNDKDELAGALALL